MLAAAVTLAALLLTAAPAAATGQPADDLSHHHQERSLEAGHAAVHAALQRDLGLSEAELERMLASQASAVALDEQLQETLGDGYAGSWFDHRTGRLTVAVTDQGGAALARDAGADTQLVSRGEQELNEIKTELDQLAVGRAAAVAGVIAWAVDPRSNQVVVTVRTGETGAAGALVDRYGDAVRIEESDISPSLTHHPWLDGGIPYDVFDSGGCSVGFNVINNSTRASYFMTAGHCHAAGDLAMSNHSGFFGFKFPLIGTVETSFFPTFDDALVNVDPNNWNQGPWVWTYPGIITINGWVDPLVGSTICKSGRTTQVTCGVITLKNESVTFPQGTVQSLTRHNACVERGDSGGSNYTNQAPGVLAVGTTTGASLTIPQGRCLQTIGQPNVSWYFPLSASLPFYQLAYGVQLMTG
jgi:streptogrisin C